MHGRRRLPAADFPRQMFPALRHELVRAHVAASATSGCGSLSKSVGLQRVVERRAEGQRISLCTTESRLSPNATVSPSVTPKSLRRSSPAISLDGPSSGKAPFADISPSTAITRKGGSRQMKLTIFVVGLAALRRPAQVVPLKSTVHDDESRSDSGTRPVLVRSGL